IIAAAVLMFAAMAVLIMYRWLTVPEPTSLFFVQGTAADAGTIVEVKAVDSEQVHRLALSADNNYTAKFPLPPGTYRLVLTKGARVWKYETTLREGSGAAVDFTGIQAQELEKKANP